MPSRVRGFAFWFFVIVKCEPKKIDGKKNIKNRCVFLWLVAVMVLISSCGRCISGGCRSLVVILQGDGDIVSWFSGCCVVLYFWVVCLWL